MTKRNFFTTAALAAALTVPLAAQMRGPEGGANRLDFLAGYLGLSESQKAQAKTIFDAAQQAATTAMGQMASAREALRDAVKAGKTDAEIDRLAAALGVIEGQLAAIHAKAQVKFYALLTAEQKAKYDQLGERRGPGGSGGPGRSRMGPPRG